MGEMEDKPKLRVMGAEKPQERGTHLVDAKDRKVPPSTQVGLSTYYSSAYLKLSRPHATLRLVMGEGRDQTGIWCGRTPF